VNGLIAFWSYGLAACLFASLLLWRLRNRIEGTEKLLLLAYFATAVWATVSAIRGPTEIVTIPTETLRNLAWVTLLYAMAGDIKSGARRGIPLVFGAVALVIGTQLVINLATLATSLAGPVSEDVLATMRLLRITMAAGSLVLVHNVYGQAAPQSRLSIRSVMLGLTLMWGYDLNLYELARRLRLVRPRPRATSDGA